MENFERIIKEFNESCSDFDKAMMTKYNNKIGLEYRVLKNENIELTLFECVLHSKNHYVATQITFPFLEHCKSVREEIMHTMIEREKQLKNRLVFHLLETEGEIK